MISASAKSRHAVAIFGIVILIFGMVLIGFGDTIVHSYPLAALSTFKAYPLAVTCTNQDKFNMCSDPTNLADSQEQWPVDKWQVRWGSINLIGNSWYWREYWYTTYRFMPKFSTDYTSNVIAPDCASGLDKNSNGGPCSTSAGAKELFGFYATRTFKAGEVRDTAGNLLWPTGQGIHVHGEWTFDDYIAVQVNLNNGGWQTIQGTSKNGQSMTVDTSITQLALSNQPLSYDKDLAASDVLKIRVLWANYVGSALINNSWDFGPQAPSCNLGQDIFSYDLVDQTHGTQSNVDVKSLTASYNVDPTFTIKANLLQSGCANLITRVPVALQQTGYSRTVAYTMTPSGSSWSVQISNLQPGTYYPNVGVETTLGTQWALSVMKMSFINAAVVNIQGGSSGNGNWYDWFTPIRDFGIILAIVGLVATFYSMPRKP